METIHKYLPGLNKIEIEYSKGVKDLKIDGKSLFSNYSYEDDYYYIGTIYKL